MSELDFDIKLNNHYKLYILLKDKIIFESELIKNGIKFYYNVDEQPSIDGGIRYFLLDSDMHKVDEIIKKNNIVAPTETNLVYDFDESKKVFKLQVLFYIAVIVLIIIIAFMVNLFV